VIGIEQKEVDAHGATEGGDEHRATGRGPHRTGDSEEHQEQRDDASPAAGGRAGAHGEGLPALGYVLPRPVVRRTLDALVPHGEHRRDPGQIRQPQAEQENRRPGEHTPGAGGFLGLPYDSGIQDQPAHEGEHQARKVEAVEATEDGERGEHQMKPIDAGKQAVRRDDGERDPQHGEGVGAELLGVMDVDGGGGGKDPGRDAGDPAESAGGPGGKEQDRHDAEGDRKPPACGLVDPKMKEGPGQQTFHGRMDHVALQLCPSASERAARLLGFDDLVEPHRKAPQFHDAGKKRQESEPGEQESRET